MRGEKGFALVLVLVVTALMVAVLAELIHQVYVDTTISRGFRDGQQASLLAESGITGGKKLLQLFLTGKDYSSLSDKWATPFKMDDETGTIEITITEESGKICLNDLGTGTFTHDALLLLGKRLQIKDSEWSDMLDSLADWLDVDDLPKGRGAESSYYMALKPPYRARNNKPLGTLAELTLVKGFTPEIVSKLAPFVTVYSEPNTGSIGQTKININTAPKEVIAALDASIDERMVERILEERRLSPFNKNTKSVATISSKLSANVSYMGTVFRITSVAKVKDAARTVEAVVWLSGEVLSWQEY